MSQTAIIILVALLAALIVGALLLRGHAAPSSGAGAPPITGKDVADSGAAAFEDIAGQLIGVDAHPDLSGPPDELTTIKGLGPKAAAQLKLLGITRFVQLAALDGAQTDALDEQMGVFRGRIVRDRWSEQARYLARGDTAGFEREFGKLG